MHFIIFYWKGYLELEKKNINQWHKLKYRYMDGKEYASYAFKISHIIKFSTICSKI